MRSIFHRYGTTGVGDGRGTKIGGAVIVAVVLALALSAGANAAVPPPGKPVTTTTLTTDPATGNLITTTFTVTKTPDRPTSFIPVGDGTVSGCGDATSDTSSWVFQTTVEAWLHVCFSRGRITFATGGAQVTHVACCEPANHQAGWVNGPSYYNDGFTARAFGTYKMEAQAWAIPFITLFTYYSENIGASVSVNGNGTIGG
jgi:hypothetical protein